MGSRYDFLEILSSHILRSGVITSCSLIAAGLIALLLGDRSSLFPQNLSQLISTDYARPTLNVNTLIKGIESFNPIFILQLGMLVLLATPILRIVVSVVYFAAKKDGKYLVVTIFILSILLFSIFLVGPLEANG